MNEYTGIERVAKEIVTRVLEEAKKYYKDKLISFVIFSSIARKRATLDSDIDILIVSTGLPSGRLKRVFEFEQNIEKK